MSAREQILQSLRQALKPLPSRTELPEIPAEIAEPQWLGREPDDLLLFQKRAEATGTKCFTDPAACAEWLRAQNVRRLYVPGTFVEQLAPHLPFCEVVTEYRREEVDAIDGAFTPAAGAIAESGTIILTDECTPDRLAALAPWHHIAILRRWDIHRTIARALAAMPADPNVIWVTGPSKTADVEGILIQGVHGPGQQACLIL